MIMLLEYNIQGIFNVIVIHSNILFFILINSIQQGEQLTRDITKDDVTITTLEKDLKKAEANFSKVKKKLQDEIANIEVSKKKKKKIELRNLYW